MALIFEDSSKCSLCGEILKKDQSITGLPHFIEDVEHDLFKYSDSGMHVTCFQNWHLLPRVIKEFNEYYRKHYRGMKEMLNDGRIVDNIDIK